MIVPLVAHPSTPNPHVREFVVHVEVGAGNTLRLRYSIEGDIERLQIPPRAHAAFTDELWKHTCFECFIKPSGAAPYLELNFSPSGEWAAYRFNEYRQGMAPLASPEAQLKIVCTQHVGRLDASVETSLEALSATLSPAATSLQIGLSAVIEDRTRGISYWAAAHPPGRPDFHHPDSFVLTWPPAGEAR